MQRDLTTASTILHALTVLACCLYVVQSATGAKNASEHQHLVVDLQPTPQAEVNTSVKPLVSTAETQQANTTSATAVSEPVNSSTQHNSSTEALSTYSTCEETVSPPWLLTQKDWCPASQGTLVADDTGTTSNATEPDKIKGPAGNTTGTAQQEVVVDGTKQQCRPEQQQSLQPQQPYLSQQQEEETDSTEEDRHNFALSKDGAKVVACNKEAKKCSAILDTDSDTFMKNDCKADKWFIVELSQVAKVDAFQLSQYELYSSRVKEFEVRGRQSHPRGQGSDYSKALNTSGWQLLGKYTAAKIRGTQAFTVPQPVWLKYLQFHFISHYGTEPMCALNDILVHGKSAAEDLEDQLSASSLLPEDDLQDDPKPHGPKDGSAEHPQAQAAPDAAAALPDTKQASVQADGAKAGLLMAENAVNDSKSSGSNSTQDESDSSVPVKERPHVTSQHKELMTSELPAQPSMDTASNTSQNVSNPNSAANAAASTSRVPDSAQATDALHEELLLLPNSASSNKARHGGSIYDMLVQEIKSLKLQQKLAPRQLAELQRNMSLYVNRTTAEINALEQSVQSLQSEVDTLKKVDNLSAESVFSDSALAKFSDVDVDLRALVRQMESVRTALHIVQHKVTAIVLMAIVAWLAVMVLTAPDLGRLTWILYVPMVMICAIGVLWLAGVLRILPNHFTVH